MSVGSILNASKLPIVLALILNVGLALVLLGALFLFKDNIQQMDSTVSMIITLTTYVVFYGSNLLLYAYAGYRAGTNFQFSALSGGVVSAFSFAVAHTIITILQILLVFVIYGSIFMSTPSSSSPAMDSIMGLVAVTGVASLIAIAVFFFIVLLSGILINFIAGAVGAYIATRKLS